MTGFVVSSTKLQNWYELRVHVPVFDGIDLEFSEVTTLDVEFEDADVPEALRRIRKGSKK